MDGSSTGPHGPDLERAERLAKAWITRLVDRTALPELGALPLGRIGAEAPPLIAAVIGALTDPARGPGELAAAAADLAQLFGESPAPTPTRTPGTTPATSSASPPGVRVGMGTGDASRDTDAVTGLAGPDGLDSRLMELLAEQRRYGHPFSVALVDVDGLARINDAYGRAGGDRLLAAVAAILRREARDVDFVFRVEDDEFAVVAPHTDPDHLVAMATRVANLIAASQAPDGPRIAIAVGVVGCPADGLAAERLLESATEAIYAAKAAGAAVARSANGPGAVLQDS